MGKVQEWESQISFGPDQLFDEAVSDLTSISTMKIVSVTSWDLDRSEELIKLKYYVVDGRNQAITTWNGAKTLQIMGFQLPTSTGGGFLVAINRMSFIVKQPLQNVSHVNRILDMCSTYYVEQLALEHWIPNWLVFPMLIYLHRSLSIHHIHQQWWQGINGGHLNHTDSKCITYEITRCVW